MTSTMCSGSLTTRGFSLAGQLTKAGTRTPPSRRLPLPPLNGALDAGGFCPAGCRPLRRPRSSLLCSPLSEQPAGRAAIVAGEQDDGVVAQALLFEFGDDAPDLDVELGDHRRIGAPERIGDGSVLVDGALRRLVRRVRGERSEIEEERLLAVLLVDELDRVVADEVGVVALFLEERAVPLPVDQAAALAGEIVTSPTTLP